jgi:hypothetical protein
MSAVAALLRSIVYEVLRFAITVIFAVISLLTFAFKPLTRYRIITAWSHLVVGLAWAVCGVRYRVMGRDNLPATPCIVLSKHQSAWETLAYQVILPPQVWVLKRELLRVPFFGWGLAMMSPIAIDRGSATRALKQTLEQGKSRRARAPRPGSVAATISAVHGSPARPARPSFRSRIMQAASGAEMPSSSIRGPSPSASDRQFSRAAWTQALSTGKLKTG